MFGKTAFIFKIVLLWCFLTIILAKTVRHKKDVHHMIYVKEKRRPPKSHRYTGHHNDHFTEDRPQKTKKKFGGQKLRDFDPLEESFETTHDKHVRHSPKSKRHHQKHTHLPGHNQKRHNDKRHHKKHQKENHHHHQNHGNHVNRDPAKFPTTNWVPMGSKEMFGTETSNFFKSNSENRQPQGYSQPIPMEITTHFPPSALSSYSFQSTIYPPLSPTFSQYLNEKSAPNSPSPHEPLNSYKPFDYSVLEQTNPNSSFQEQEPASSNVVKVKHSGEKDSSSLPIVVNDSRENLGSREKKEEKKMKKNEGSGIKSEKSKVNAKRPRGGTRYRIRTKH